MVSLGLVLLTGVAGVMSFGQQVFAGIAAYTTAVITTEVRWLALAGSRARIGSRGGGRAVSGRHRRCRLSGHYLPISTIAWGIAIYFMFGNLELFAVHGVPDVPRLARARTSPISVIWAVTLGLLLASANCSTRAPGRHPCAALSRRHGRTRATTPGRLRGSRGSR